MAAALAAALAVFAIATPSASAQELRAEVIPKSDPAKDIPSDIEITIVGGPSGVTADKFDLVQNDDKRGPIDIKASALKTYVEGPDEIAIVVLVEAHELWIGNDTWQEDPSNAYKGTFQKLVEAIDPLSHAGPPGSKGALLTYSQGVQTRLALSDLSQLTGDKLGTQKELAGKFTRDLVAGLTEAQAVLNKIGTSRKALVVIGDGMDTNNETAGAQIQDLKKKFQNDRVDVYAIYVSSEGISQGIQDDPNGFKKLTSNTQQLNGVDGLPPAISKVVDAINDRYYVRFPGADIKLKKSFTWDGKGHTFTVKFDKDEWDVPDEILMTPKWVPPWKRPKGGFPWLWVILGVLGAGILAVVGIKVLGGKKEAPMPVIEAPPPVAAPAPAAAPAGPMKTVMIGIGGDDGGFPVVGWIVPMNGPNQFQTFKLLGGATKIGTNAPAHIIINDGFMSTEHCQIIASPAGFVLKDGGSTNGTYVNDRKVDTHELVDNDVILMGKTSFKFKSIN
ncbi:MAG: FHA domain-containing protein [Kofleriaceae bacterium]|nr:FHA domain-containing protein [Myxococcales bacterium]MCB9561034.1 FHA domain-containing protein [Kofleriaceae bacterium]